MAKEKGRRKKGRRKKGPRKNVQGRKAKEEGPRKIWPIKTGVGKYGQENMANTTKEKIF